MAQAKITRDTLSPALAKAARGLKDKRPLLEAMGLAVVSVTIRAFNNPSLRPAPWKNKADGTPSRLRKNNVLARSPRVGEITQTTVTVVSDRPYAAIHQFGGEIRAKGKKALHFKIGGVDVFVQKVVIPARPFMPITPDGRFTEAGMTAVMRAARGKLKGIIGPGGA